MSAASKEEVLAATRAWLENQVIALNLCPFARAVHVSGRIRYVVSEAQMPHRLRTDLIDELLFLKSADPEQTETTLLIHPYVLEDFLEYNDFLDIADDVIRQLGLNGDFQIASFHPRYQFEGTEPDDVTNRTNRSPYPILQILRESSVERAIEETPDIDQIAERNMETMRRLGHTLPPPPP